MTDIAFFTQKLARDTGAILLGFVNQTLDKHIKADTTFATQADQAAEDFMVSSIQAAFPNDAVLGEETGRHGAESAQHTWIIDPLDGTSNFFNTSDQYGVMIAHASADQVDAGCLFFPALKKLVWAERGGGTWINGERLKLALPMSFAGYAVAVGRLQTGQPGDQKIDELKQVLSKMKIDLHSTMSSAANALAMLEGTHAAFVINMNHTWDNAAPGIILEEAGFSVTDWARQPLQWRMMRQDLLACPPALTTFFLNQLM